MRHLRRLAGTGMCNSPRRYALGERLPAIAEPAWHPGRDEVASFAARARAEIDDMVGSFEGIAVVLN